MSSRKSGRGRGRNSRRSSGGRGGGRGGNHGNGNSNSSSNTNSRQQPDEDVLIEFMPYMRNEHPIALKIHQAHGGDERAFVQAAREFLKSEKGGLPTSQMEKLSVHDDPVFRPSERSPKVAPIARSPPRSPVPTRSSASPLPPGFHVAPPGLPGHRSPQPMMPSTGNRSPATPRSQQHISPLPSRSMVGMPPGLSPMTPSRQMSPVPVPTQSLANLPPGLQQPSALKPSAPGLTYPQQQPSRPMGNWQPSTPGMTRIPTSPVPPPQQQPHASSTTPPPPTAETTTATPVEPTVKPRPVWQPKRVWTRLDQQPGRILANDVTADSPMLPLRPRQELTAKWMLPLKYLRQRMTEKDSGASNMTIRDALSDLTVGLFRRGCTENGTNASIISKEILAPATENRNDYPFSVDQRSDVIYGTVPFYAPRTPGHVLFRLFWQDEPLYTLATGPTLFVRVTEEDFEPTLRFILSNFKSRKGSATSLSSLNALSTVLEQFRPTKGGGQQRRSGWDSAGRAAWGCICESRKVLDVCASEYGKGKEKVRKLEVEVEELKGLVEQEEEETKSNDGNNDDDDDDKSDSSNKIRLKEKTHALMGGRASTDRKWKDAQVAFSTILKSVVCNQSASLLFRRELIAKIRLEYELWCSLVETFAPSPFNSNPESLTVNFNEFPQHVTPPHYQQCAESRRKLQQEMLGFVPNRKTLQETLYRKPNQPMDRRVVNKFNDLSGAMGKLYEEVYMVSERIMQQREMVRSHLESIVQKCDSFPPGTRVMVFGSSANGFGSPSSDLDMCLQLPPNTKLPGAGDDPTGGIAMGKLAQALEQSDMQNVDTCRLTARIPIIMFNCPRPMAQEGEDPMMECDLSFLNNLAVLNTSLLLGYSRIHPVTRVLAAIIKRWAKARDINNPSKHTLSSYGYILMLIHFLTYHRRKGDGLVATLDSERTSNSPITFGPLLPNLQWVDGSWLQSPSNTPYAELDMMPRQLIQHPLEEKMVVNTYFHRIQDAKGLMDVQNRFPSQDLSLAILLASFFRYFAFEFDYKRHIVSLHARAKRGMVEREIKAETNGWKVYSTGLSIEDPFETFYDVAHVLKGANFHRLRNELALAYTKIVNAVEEKGGNGCGGRELIDLICEPLEKKEGEGA